jgi:hypothetical protein
MYADIVGRAMLALVIVTAVVSVVITATITSCTMWMLTPTAASKEREAARQAIVERLTPEERDILGVR